MKQTYTLVLIKPDGVERGLVGQITSRFEQRGLKLCNIRFVDVAETMEKLDNHYPEHVGKPYYPEIVKSMTMGPLVAQVWSGLNVVSVVRQMIGSTDPQLAAPGTIRGDYAMHKGRNIIHSSDSVESSRRECQLWFGKVPTGSEMAPSNYLIYRL